MDVQYSLKRLLPKENHRDISKIKPSPQIAAPARRRARAGESMDASLTAEGLARSAGHAGLENGNHFHGMPQTGLELRAPAETAFDHGVVSGAFPIYMDEAQVQLLTLGADTSITFDLATWTPRRYASAQNHGIDIAVTLIIQKGASALTINANHWAPYDEAPDLSAPGYYEIGFAIVRVGTKKIIRAYPAIRPAPPAPAA